MVEAANHRPHLVEEFDHLVPVRSALRGPRLEYAAHGQDKVLVKVGAPGDLDRVRVDSLDEVETESLVGLNLVHPVEHPRSPPQLVRVFTRTNLHDKGNYSA